MLECTGSGRTPGLSPTPSLPGRAERQSQKGEDSISEGTVRLIGFSFIRLLFSKWEDGKKLACSWRPSGPTEPAMVWTRGGGQYGIKEAVRPGKSKLSCGNCVAQRVNHITLPGRVQEPCCQVLSPHASVRPGAKAPRHCEGSEGPLQCSNFRSVLVFLEGLGQLLT